MPVTASGYRPQLAEGYRRFVQAPEIAKTASAMIENQLATNATNPMDSHPPLSARVKKARSLAIATPAEDNRPAVSLFDDLQWLELQLLTKLMPARKPSELKPIQWDNAGSDVPANRLLLLGQPNFAHATLADFLEQMIRTDDGAPVPLRGPHRAGSECRLDIVSVRWRFVGRHLINSMTDDNRTGNSSKRYDCGQD